MDFKRLLVYSHSIINECAVVTDNEKDFVGIKTVNPMREGTR